MTDTASGAITTGDQSPMSTALPLTERMRKLVAAATPGPWHTRKLTNLTKIKSDSIEGWDPLGAENVTAILYPTDKTVRDEGNAALIAAAPSTFLQAAELIEELAAALDSLLSMSSACTKDDEVIENNRRREEARAALAKARAS